MQIQFNKHNVVNKATGKKARVTYTCGQIDGIDCVTLYDKDYGHALSAVFDGEGYENNSDSQTDYFEKGRVRIKAGSPMYGMAYARAKGN